MKRTNLVLDDKLLEQAMRIFGEKTYSGAVNRALAEVVRMNRVSDLYKFVGSGVWQGDMSEMREDKPG